MARKVSAGDGAGRGTSTTPVLILESARNLFQEKGYERTSMSDIAGRIGISAPSVYWHYASKEAILYEILRAQLSDFYAEIQRMVDAADTDDRLRILAESHVRYQLDRLDQARGFTQIYGLAQLSHALTDDHLIDLRMTERKYLMLVESILRDGREAGQMAFDDLGVTAFAVITMCENVTAWAKPGGRLATHEIARLISGLITHMVSA